MHRHPIVRTGSLGLLAAGVFGLRALAGDNAAANEYHATPPDDPQSSLEFVAEGVHIEERHADQVTRVTRAARARLRGHRLESEQVRVEVPPHRERNRPSWSMSTAWLVRSLEGDEARIGPVEVVTEQGDRIAAQGGVYDGNQRRLSLQGPVSLSLPRGHSHASEATVFFSGSSTEVEEILLIGEVTGILVVAPNVK